MNTPVAVLLVVMVPVVGANWWSRWRDHRLVEWITKPAVTIGIIVTLVVADTGHGDLRGWFLAAFVMCLAGDVLLMVPSVPFVAGLGSFLVGQVLLLVTFIGWPSHRPVLAVVGLVAVVALLATVGRRVVAGAASQDSMLRLPVLGYLGAIGAMAVSGWSTGELAAIIGVTAFVVSDSILGWNAFVAKLSWAPVAIMATYHVALFGLLATAI